MKNSGFIDLKGLIPAVLIVGIVCGAIVWEALKWVYLTIGIGWTVAAALILCFIFAKLTKGM